MEKPTDNFRDRISYLDEFGQRLRIIPAEVRGVWRNRRSLVHVFLMVLFLALPWIKVNGYQALFLDFANRQFTFFGLRFWSHDAPLFFLVLASLALGLALVTALFGRVWCGWACPQTVFLDGFIRRIENWIEGNHLQQRALDAAPWGLSKIFKKISKWILFVGFVALLTHSFLAYFVGGDRLLEMVQRPPAENWWNFSFILATTGVLLIDLTWFREQFCLIVCPYGRFQSILHDRDTVTVQYDVKRGEPRRGSEGAVGAQGSPVGSASRGHCIDCRKCVQVCPTGIDIRNGLQIECIACTACIDACDEIMEKVKQPKGLIRYMPSVNRQPRWFRSRVLLYAGFLIVLISVLAFAVIRRDSLAVAILRTKELPFFVKESPVGPIIVNSYRLHVHNEGHEDQSLQISLSEKNPWVSAQLLISEQVLRLKEAEFRMIPFIVEVPQSDFPALQGKKLIFKVQEQEYEVDFVGPRD